MAARRRNKVVVWEWARHSNDGPRKPLTRDREKGFALIATGVGLLFFSWLFAVTGIFTARRGNYVVTAAEDPERFSYALGLVIIVAIGSLLSGVVTLRRR